MIVAGDAVLALDMDVFAFRLTAETRENIVCLCFNQECGHEIGDPNCACVCNTVTGLLDRGRTGSGPAADRHLISRI